MFYLDCALSWQELYGTVVALRPTFLITLVNHTTAWFTISNAMLR
jgi:hypothetical protein